MTTREKVVALGLGVSLVAAAAAAVLTRDWANYHERLRALGASSRTAAVVDTRELDTALQIAQLAITRTERDYAQQALEQSDHGVDLALQMALRDASDEHGSTAAHAHDTDARVQTTQAAVQADQQQVEQLQKQRSDAKPDEKAAVDQELEIAQEQSSVDQNELADARADLARSGGDKTAFIQRQLVQHEASQAHGGKSLPSTNPDSEVEATTSSSILAQARALRSLSNKASLLLQARDRAASRRTALSAQRASLQKRADAEKPHDAHSGRSAQGSPPRNTALSALRHRNAEQKDVADLGEGIAAEEELGAIYANWLTFVDVREKALFHGLLVAICWILSIAVGVVVANHSVQRLFANVTLDRRELHTMRTVALVLIQVGGIALILLVIFGVPSNVSTLVALATAGVTVALKDFILGFVGWFSLMGNHGIRPGDWVEINGITGEVAHVGLFRTVLHETGSWSDAAHPTGRSVSFVNSFAIEGHYFNFSASGQWIWDELQVEVPSRLDPQVTAEAIRKIVDNQTAESAQQAAEEWSRGVRGLAKRTVSVAPVVSVKPAGRGVSVAVRYLTRVRERHEVRGRLNRAIVQLLHRRRARSEVSPLADESAST